MSQIKNRILFYHNLAVMLDSGMSLDYALRQHFPGRFHSISENLRRSVQAGNLFHEAMKQSRAFSDFECNITAVGESGGKLPDALASLDEWLSRSLDLRRKICKGLVLPVFLYSAAALILTGTDFFLKKMSPLQTIRQLSSFFIIPALLVILFALAAACYRKFAISGYLLEPIPILGSLQHKLETSRFFQALGISLSSGIPMIRSIRIAALCCRNRYYTGRYLKMIPMIRDEQETFSSAFQRIQIRRDTFSPVPALISTGEISGQLDSFCARIGKLLHDEADHLLSRLSGTIPVLLYLLILVFIAWKIIGLFSGYIQQLNTL